MRRMRWTRRRVNRMRLTAYCILLMKLETLDVCNDVKSKWIKCICLSVHWSLPYTFLHFAEFISKKNSRYGRFFDHRNLSTQSWQWVTVCDPWPTWPIIHPTRNTHDPWPMTKSQTVVWVDDDYSRIMMSSRLPFLLCNYAQSGILNVAYSVNIFIVYTVSLVVYTHTRQFLQAEHGELFFNFSLV